MFSKAEYERRVKGLQKVLREQNIDGALLVQKADVLYFTGSAQDIHLYLPQEGTPLVLVYRNLERAAKESPWEVRPLPKISKLPEIISEGYPVPQSMGMEFDVLPVANYFKYQKLFPETKLVDISYPLRLLRAVKSAEEIRQIEANGQIYAEILAYAASILRPGMTEIELEAMIEAKARMLGHEAMVRTRGLNFEFNFGGVFAGPQGAAPGCFNGPVTGLGVSAAVPLGSSNTPIKPGDPIMLDLTIAQNGYVVDTTRMLVSGSLAPKLEEAYKLCLEIQERTRQALVPGRKAGEVYDGILDWVARETPYPEYFMGVGSERVGFIGHGVGLELNELPTLSKGAQEVLAPGMTIAVEPKFVFPGEGAIGIEDTFVIEGDKGARSLCPAPKTITRV